MPATEMLVFFFLGLLGIRILYVFWRTCKPHARPAHPRSFKTLIVLGSGGHTAEMLNLTAVLDKRRFHPRFYIAALTDNMSLSRAKLAEAKATEELSSVSGVQENNHYIQIYRSREVGQSYVTSMATTIVAIAHGLWLVFRIRPEIVLCNGPGTCIPICVAGFLLKVMGVKWVVIVYVESIARVRRLSLSGTILYKLKLADQFFVQWPQLQQKFPRSSFVGRLM